MLSIPEVKPPKKFNPYRQGVLIHNYVEDMFGEELKKKYRSSSVQKERERNIISENKERFQWPKIKPSDIKLPHNECNSNFDFKIDFSIKNCSQYLNLLKKSGDISKMFGNSTFKNNENKEIVDTNEEVDKEKDLKGELKDIGGKLRGSASCKNFNGEGNKLDEKEVKKDRYTCVNNNPSLLSLQGSKITSFNPIKNSYNFNDRFSKNVPLKTKSVIVQNDTPATLLFGHGPSQRDFYKGDFASVYHLSHDKREDVNKILLPEYKIDKPFMHPPAVPVDDKNWDFRKYKIYDYFTKSFDRKNFLNE